MTTDKTGVTGPARSRPQSAAFEALISSQSHEVREIARDARELVLQVLPGAIETIWQHQGTCSYGTGPSKMKDHFTYFTFAKRHLSFGFYKGAQLPDPKGLLEGTGKAMRSTKISSRADVEDSALHHLLEEAVKLAPPLGAASRD